MKIHELKSWPKYFEKVVDGSKTFEVRLNDRDFKVGDFLFLREYDPETKQYSGRFQYARVSYILGSEEHGLVSPNVLHPDYVILAIMLTWSTQSPVPQGQEQAPQARPEPDWLCSQPDCGLWHSEHRASHIGQATAAAGAESTAGPTYFREMTNAERNNLRRYYATRRRLDGEYTPELTQGGI